MRGEYKGPFSRPLTKRWFALRHGRSEANENGIIASQLVNAETAYGLTGTGRAEVTASVNQAIETLLTDPPLFIFMSPFLRARQTAAIAGTILGVSPAMDSRLRERNFGRFELLSDAHYQRVWDLDPINPTAVPGGVETVYEVANRTTKLVLEWEKCPEFNTGLLVTHCDVAMILSCAIQDSDPCHHRSLNPIKTGEIRLLSP